jgi:signal transduction histidine kinase
VTGRFWFDWPLLALSLANGILLLWLGLTVLLNAERRTPGVALLALAAWLGSAFFAAHTAILASGEGPASAALNLWWEVGWLPLLALPLAWYGVVLWYGGYGGEGQGLRRHRLPLALAVITFGGLTAAFFASAGLPSFLDAVNLRFGATATLFGAPWFLVLYPAYILVCVALSFDALLRPAPAPSRQSTAARLRARPWLLTANTLLVMVGGLVAVLLIWVARTPGPTATNELFSATLLPLDPWTATTASARHLALAIAWTDLLVSALLAVVIFCMSYALVQYEIFSGRALPRRALRRHWRTALLLAVGYGVVVGATLAAGWRPVYSLLLTALLMTFFFALLGWRTFAAQSDFVRRLQPFVVSTHLAEELIAPAPVGDAATAQDAAATFAALCREVLHTEYAALAATGALAALVDAPLVYPAEAPPPGVLPPLPATAGAMLAVAIDAPGLPQVAWALPIQGPQGPVGVMLLGRRRGDDLYAEEEIAIARATGERLLDLLAAAALARRLLDLTREQWAEGQVADRQTRRVLHDEVLPDLHAALIMLSQGDASQIALARDLLATAHRQTAALLRGLPARPPVRPSGHLLADLRRLVEEEMASRFDTVHFAADDAATVTAARLRPLHAEVVFYAVRELARNAARHGHGARAPFTLTVTAMGGSELEIVVCDNGQSVPAAGGAGQGLALHTAMLAVVGGGISLTQMAAGGSQAVLRIATTPTVC